MNQRGSATTELTLLTPLLLALLLLVVLAGRLSTTRNALVGTARDAARAATMKSDAGVARAAAEQAARASLAQTRCANLAIDIAATETPGGRLQPGSMVTVTVRCTVALSDLALLAIPGDKTVTATASEVVDRYRGER